MKKIIITLWACFLFTGVWAQLDKGAKIVTVSQTVQEGETIINGNSATIQMQIGLPFIVQDAVQIDTQKPDSYYGYINFPWNILYLYDTFSTEPTAFDISKGFFGDKVIIRWELKSNYDIIKNIKIYRRKYTESNILNWQFLSNVSKDDTQYEDLYIDGGILYEYKVEADGIVGDDYLQKFITGIGFRSPTAVVTGNVNYDGGSPVPDVTVTAESEGSSVNLGSALNIKNNGFLKVIGVHNPIETATTVQAWVKPETPFTTDTDNAIKLFNISDGTKNFEVLVNLLASSNSLQISVDGTIFTMQDFYPSGDINPRGDDELAPVADFNTTFTHISVVIENDSIPKLYINGRPITKAYETLVQNIEGSTTNADGNLIKPYETFTVSEVTTTSDLTTTSENKWNAIEVGGTRDAFIDEIRLWKDTISAKKIRTDYKRYISGNDSRLVAYLRADEGLGGFAYDYSRDGFNYNKNHGEFESETFGVSAVTWISGAGNVPTADQLGVLGVTDDNGNYQIAAIPYSGTGESFTISPSYGLHQFEPSQKLVFLGEGSTVVNEINFVDKSSFIFKGKILYDTRGVFQPFADAVATGAGITQDGYNMYRDLNGVPFAKGQHWLNDGADPDSKADDTLEEYAQIFVGGANVYIDGDIVLDENNIPVVTDEIDGSFQINVPIGNHFITVKKQGHVFEFNGRFPEYKENTEKPEENFSEFVQNREDVVVFIDKTRVTVVGRVVGGAVEAQKEIGFGQDGLYNEVYSDANGNNAEETISSINNMGQANITFNYPDHDKVQDETKFTFSTNMASGEFRVEVLPITYKYKSSDINIINNTDNITIGSADVLDLNFTAIPELITPEFESENITTVTGVPYHYKQSFNYRAIPVLNVIEQQSEESIDINGQLFVTDGFEYPIYEQFKSYNVELRTFEKYTNYDGAQAVESIVPVIDGELIVNNNLALDGTETYVTNPQDASYATYSFQGGIPSFAANNSFVKTMSIKYRVNGVDYDPIGDYTTEGIVLGGASDGAKTFTTSAPDVPDIILRDPPGSNSFASIEAGQSISFNASNSFVDSNGLSQSIDIEFGTETALTPGVAPAPITTALIEDGLNISASLNYTSTNGKSITKTYTFNQTISTSDDPDWVGADADLYIGNSLNYFHSKFNKLQMSDIELGDPTENIELVNDAGESVFLSVQTAFAMSPDPSETFFVYSQRYILEDLIPEYEAIITAINVPGSTLIPGEDGVLTVEEYERQILVWKKMILKNELDKYIALDPKWRGQKKEILEFVTAAYNNDLEDVINDSDDPLGEFKLKDKLANSKRLTNLLEEYYSQNISFDAGVGEISRSVEAVTIIGNSITYDITLDESIALTFGFTLNKTGMVSSTSGFFQQNINTALSSEDETTTTFSYTIKDNDEANLLSLDIINEFGDYGPVFSTQGGRTSCPQEGPELSNFFTKTKFETYVSGNLPTLLDLQVELAEKRKLEIELRNPEVSEIEYLINKDKLASILTEIDRLEKKLQDLDEVLISDITCCENDEKAPLSFGTQKVEVPLLSVDIADVSNIPESENAEFTLLLENNSASGTDATFLLKVDNTTNPNNAITNIEPNGTLVNVPYGVATTYKLTLGKSISDVYDYKDIRIVLQSLCDGEDVSDDILVSASFVPSCSNVVVSAPVDNWVYNIGSAFNTDGSTKPLTINLNGFNASFNSFEKIDLQYRLATSPNWSTLHTYYADQTFYDDAILAGASENQISIIESADLAFPFDIVDQNLQDGEYEIRARSSCTNDTEFISEVITGTVDLNAPLRFGTPLPTDGILGAGEDFKVSFNENIFYNTAISKIEILGATNQLPITNNVSLYFEGANNTVTIEKPRIVTGDFSLEFWMNNPDINVNATIFSQIDGLNISMVGGELSATIGGITATGGINPDKLFHHYTITHNNDTGSLSIYEDDRVVAETTGAPNVQFGNSNTLDIGGNTFVGNIHDLRLWGKSLTLSNAYANIYTQIIGNEAKLLGYWPMSEGRGTVANDKAFFRHASVNADWDIKPKGNSYEFTNGHYLELDKMGFAQLTNTMDATISFWIKTEKGQESTIFSNGKGDGTDPVQTNGLTNKWAINMSSAGTLSFESEGQSYPLTFEGEAVADNRWHHVTLLFNRLGSLRTYVDAEQVSSNSMAAIGGFSGNVALLGARLSITDVIRDKDTNEILDIVYEGDRVFSGKIDEFRMWNSLRAIEQITRDQFNEVDNQSIGLMLYARMNAPDPSNANGPRYYHTASGEDNIPDNAKLKNGVVNYADDVPAIKPARNLIKFEVNHVINEDDMIIEPVVSDWAVLEGQVLDVTVHRMFDASNNRQESPITWTAFIQRNTVSWYAEGFNEVVNLDMENGEAKTFNLVIINKGGVSQSYNIANVPNWMTLSSSSGNIPPDSQITVTATIDSQLSTGEYLENLSLQTDFGFDQKLQVALRVLGEEPDWSINPNDFDYSMNIIGKIKIDNVFSDDLLDKVVAFSNGEVRGVTNVVYNAAYQEYFVFLTVYSNNASGDPINFSIWDATQGIIMQSTINSNDNAAFKQDQVLGSLANVTLFENSGKVQQQIVTNPGWTWISMHVNDPNATNLNALIANATLETNDRILSHSPARSDIYTKDTGNPGQSTWSGSISADENRGLSPNYMYKVYFKNKQTMNIKGIPVDIGSWSFLIKENWSWLPYPLKKNVSVNEALSLFDAAEDDIIKSQNLFAIYDARNGWIGTLNYLEAGQGYMIKSSTEQTFKYSNIYAKTSKQKGSSQNDEQARITPEFAKYSENMNAVVLLPEGYDELFVYDADGVLKGQTKNLMVGDKALSFISIYGESNEALTFHVGNDQEQRATTKSITFKGNDVIGTVANPLILEEGAVGAFKIHPNPFSKELTLELYSEGKQPMGITLYNMVGQLVYSDEKALEKGNNTLQISPQLSQGVYFLNISLKDVVKTYRVIKN